MSRFFTKSEGIWARAMRDHNFAAILDWFTTYFFGCGIAILVVGDVVAWADDKASFGTVVRVAGGSLMLAAAAVVSGWLFGLLFGIPRSLSRPQAAAGQPIGPAPRVPDGNSFLRPSKTNTNLEDVSDWLTKTIVGLGLANLYIIPGYAWRKSGQIGEQIFAGDKGGQSFVFLISVYFSVGGFWIGYIGTRTMVTLLFDVIDRGDYNSAVAEAADPQNLQVDETGKIKPASDGLQQADAQMLERPLQAMNNATELAAWAAAKARSGDWGTALAVLGEAVKSAPGDAAIQSLLSVVSSAAKSPGPEHSSEH